MSKYNLTEILSESFDSLAKKLDKQKGIDKDDAAKIAGSIAAKKMAGAGKGPTAKQKARVKEEEVSDKEQVFDVIYAAGGKDVAPDFMDAIGEEFEIPFEFGGLNEQSKPVNEDREVFNRIDGLVNQNFKFNMLDEFIKLYADLTQDDPYDSEDVLMYLHGEMANFLKEKGMYEDGFNPDDMMDEAIDDLPDEIRKREQEKIERDARKMEAIDDLPDEIRKREQEKIERDARKMESIKEDNFDELKKHQEMMKDAADFFRDKAEELDVDTNKIMDFNKGVNDLVQDVFDADYKRSGGKIDEDLFSKDGGSEDNVDNIDRVSSPSTKGVGYDQVSKANTAEDDMESKETLNPKPMYEDLKKHFKRFI